MSEKPKTEQIGIINLRTLRKIVICGGTLTAPLEPVYAKRIQGFKPPIRQIVFVDKYRIVGHGIVTDSWNHCSDHTGKSVVAFDIQPFKTHPESLSSIQRAALSAYLEQYGVKQKNLTGVMPLELEMDSLFPEPIYQEPVLLGDHSESWLRAERQSIHCNESLSLEEKLRLLQALDKCGDHANDVEALHTIVCGEGSQDFEPHPILPWERCTKDQRLDPHNWVLLPSALASNFRMGLITFSDTGGSILSKALLSDLHQFDIYYDFRLYTLTEQQRQYMKIHREAIFNSWRTNPPWLG